MAVGLQVANTVWFPLLRSYVEPGAIGRFFGLLRTSWSLALIFYFFATQYWLSHHPGEFGPPFAVAILCGLMRVAPAR